MANKPTVVANWADSGSVVDPGAVKRDLGWVASEAPPFDFFNYLHNASGQWMTWLDEQFEDGPVADDLRINPPGVLYLKSRFAVASSQSVIIEVDTENGGTTDPSALILENDSSSGDAVTSFLMRTDGDELFEIRTDHDAFDTLFYNDSNAQPSMVLSGDNVLIGQVGQGNKLQIPSGNSHEIFGTFDVTENGTTDFSKAADPSLTNGALWLRDGFIKTSDGTNTYPVCHKMYSNTAPLVVSNIGDGTGSNFPDKVTVVTIPSTAYEVGTVIKMTAYGAVSRTAPTLDFNFGVGIDSTVGSIFHHDLSTTDNIIYAVIESVITVRSISATVGTVSMSSRFTVSTTFGSGSGDDAIEIDTSATFNTTGNLTLQLGVDSPSGETDTINYENILVEVLK